MIQAAAIHRQRLRLQRFPRVGTAGKKRSQPKRNPRKSSDFAKAGETQMPWKAGSNTLQSHQPRSWGFRGC